MLIRFSVTLLIYTSRCSHDGKDAFQKTLAQHLARRNEANMSTSFKFAQEEEPDPKKKPDSKKKKHDPLAGTLIKQHKPSKTDPFAGTKRKKRKQKHDERGKQAARASLD